MYLMHANGSYNDPRTLNPPTIAITLPSNTFMALSRRFELTLERLHIVAESLSVLSSIARRLLRSPVAYRFWVAFGFCKSSISGIIPIPYIANARGSLCVVPAVDVKTGLLTYKFEGSSYELASACYSARQKISTFFRAGSLLRELKAFSASISSMAFVSQTLSTSCGYDFRFHTSGLSRVGKFSRDFSDLIYCVILLPIIRLRISPKPMGFTPGFLSRGIRRHQLYAVRFSWRRIYFLLYRITLQLFCKDQWMSC